MSCDLCAQHEADGESWWLPYQPAGLNRRPQTVQNVFHEYDCTLDEFYNMDDFYNMCSPEATCHRVSPHKVVEKRRSPSPCSPTVGQQHDVYGVKPFEVAVSHEAAAKRRRMLDNTPGVLLGVPCCSNSDDELSEQRSWTPDPDPEPEALWGTCDAPHDWTMRVEHHI